MASKDWVVEYFIPAKGAKRGRYTMARTAYGSRQAARNVAKHFRKEQNQFAAATKDFSLLNFVSGRRLSETALFAGCIKTRVYQDKGVVA